MCFKIVFKRKTIINKNLLISFFLIVKKHQSQTLPDKRFLGIAYSKSTKKKYSENLKAHKTDISI